MKVGFPFLVRDFRDGASNKNRVGVSQSARPIKSPDISAVVPPPCLLPLGASPSSTSALCVNATCQRHMKGGLAWLAWVAVGEKRENAPARSNGHHQWPGAHRECCAGVQPCVRAGLRGSRLSQVLNTLHLRLSVLKQCVTPLHDAFSYV